MIDPMMRREVDKQVHVNNLNLRTRLFTKGKVLLTKATTALRKYKETRSDNDREALILAQASLAVYVDIRTDLAPTISTDNLLLEQRGLLRKTKKALEEQE